MRNLITFTLILISLGSYSQVTRIDGKRTNDSLEVISKRADSDFKLSYVANSSLIQEFADDKLVDKMKVLDVQFYPDKIFYRVENSSESIFGITYTFDRKSVFFGDIDGNFVEFSGEGLSFVHQY